MTMQQAVVIAEDMSEQGEDCVYVVFNRQDNSVEVFPKDEFDRNSSQYTVLYGKLEDEQWISWQWPLTKVLQEMKRRVQSKIKSAGVRSKD